MSRKKKRLDRYSETDLATIYIIGAIIGAIIGFLFGLALGLRIWG